MVINVNINNYRRVFLEGENVPTAAVSEECDRERATINALPPINYIHIWWARRPLTASRFALIGSLLGDSWDYQDILELLGVPRDKDPVSARLKIKKIKMGLEKDPGGDLYGYKRAFTGQINPRLINKFQEACKSVWGVEKPVVLDMFSGGGSIPFEATRLGLNPLANELNPVACLSQEGTLNVPVKHGLHLLKKFHNVVDMINHQINEELSEYFPKKQGEEFLAYIWVRSVKCPHCGFETPLTPNWWLDKGNNLGFRPIINDELPRPHYEVCKAGVNNFDPKKGNQAQGVGECIRCGRTILGDYIKSEAQEGRMYHQLAAVRHRITGKSGLFFRSPEAMDIIAYDAATKKLNENWLQWETEGIIPTEERYDGPADRCINYGIIHHYQLFNSRQLLVHLITLKKIKEYPWENINNDDERRSIRILTTFVMDKCLDYNSLIGLFIPSKAKIAHVFSRHDFSFSWNYGEPDGSELFEWGINQVQKAYKGCVKLLDSSNGVPQLVCGDARNLNWINDQSVHAIVTDPPYYENVMYAELSDFFYVWHKRIIQDLFVNRYSSTLTDKDNEAIANSSRFKEISGAGSSARGMALEDYEMKMTQAWQEAFRVLVDGGVLTIMFNHKKLEAWDALAKSIINAGFTITSSLAVSTEFEYSLHIREKQAVQRTIFLIARKVPRGSGGWWEDVKKSLRFAVEDKLKRVVKETPHLSRIDLLMSAYGEGLRIVSSNWPVRDSKGGEIEISEALVAARSVLQDWYFENRVGHRTDIDIQTKVVLYALEGYGERTAEYDDVRTYGMALGMDLQDLYSSKIAERCKSKVLFISPEERSKETNKIDPSRDHYSLVWDMVQAASLTFISSSADDFRRWLRNKGFMANRPFLDACVFLATEGPSDIVETKMARSIHAVTTPSTTTGAVQKRMFDFTE